MQTQHGHLGVLVLLVVARRGGAERLPRWGESAAFARGVWRQAVSLPELPVLGAGGRGPLPVFSGPGWCGCGDPALLGGQRLGIHPPPAARPSGRQPGSAAYSLWARAGCAAVGTWHWPLGLRALLGVARRGGCRRLPPGGHLWQLQAESGVRRTASPSCPSFGRVAGARCP